MTARILRLGVLLVLAATLAGCATPPTHPALRSSRLPELLPLRKFVAAQDTRPGYALSPDGSKLRWSGHDGGGPAVYVRDVGGDRQLVFRTGGKPVTWAGDSRHLAYEADPEGDGNTQIMLIDTQQPDAPPRNLTPWKGSKSMLVDHADARRIVFVSNRREQGQFDAYGASLKTKKPELLLQNSGEAGDIVMDVDHEIGARVRAQGDDFILQLRTEGGRWKSVYSWSQLDSVTPLAVDRARGRALLASNVGRDKTALVELSLADRSERVLSSHPGVDVHRVVLDPDGRPLAVWYDPDLPRTVLLDPALQARLQRALPDDAKTWRLQNADRGGKRMIVSVYAGKGWMEALFERASGQLTILADSRKDPALAELVSTRPIRYQAGDGAEVHGYLTLPGTAGRPLPMLVWVHDGPWKRSFWEPSDWQSLAQFFANRGYAVLDVNYRGSRGYGRAYMEAAIGELDGRLQQDIADGVAWAVAAGIADPRSIAIGGAGFGGYSTLEALTRQPERFACGIDVVGIADMTAAMESYPRHWKPWLPLWRRYAGDGTSPASREQLAGMSPLYRADRIRVPLLVIQGAQDVALLQDHTERIVRALQAQKKPVQFLLFADEGRDIMRQPNRLRMYRKIEDFLADCLGGRSGGPLLPLR